MERVPERQREPKETEKELFMENSNNSNNILTQNQSNQWLIYSLGG